MGIELDRGFVFYGLVYVFVYFRYWRKKALKDLVWFSLFYFYICAVIDLTILPLPLNLARIRGNFMIHQGRSIWDYVNLVPDFSFENFRSRNMVLNVVMTIPFGFFINVVFLKGHRFMQTLKYGFLFTLSIETTQLLMILVLGSFKIVDVDDLIANTLGALIGFCLYKVMHRFTLFRRIQ